MPCLQSKLSSESSLIDPTHPTERVHNTNKESLILRKPKPGAYFVSNAADGQHTKLVVSTLNDIWVVLEASNLQAASQFQSYSAFHQTIIVAHCCPVLYTSFTDNLGELLFMEVESTFLLGKAYINREISTSKVFSALFLWESNWKGIHCRRKEVPTAICNKISRCVM